MRWDQFRQIYTRLAINQQGIKAAILKKNAIIVVGSIILSFSVIIVKMTDHTLFNNVFTILFLFIGNFLILGAYYFCSFNKRPILLMITNGIIISRLIE